MPSGPPGVSIFSLEGRSAPALYLIGWVGSILGLAIVVTSFASGGALSGAWLFLAGIVILALGLLAATGSRPSSGRAASISRTAVPRPCSPSPR